ncbi:hypothetical protein [Haloarchaeobius litoreus]|uniref:Uncharacterized protein n=1 Tax=Haloarchaeobius litoreus TaxID=755306 RepID=A0ABD6DPX6_9EURY|nr:hypothetical protein [Haloarchaeobius litoreus]
MDATNRHGTARTTRSYYTVEFTSEDCTYVGFAVDKTVNSEYADRDVVAAYRVPEGTVELEDLMGAYRRRHPSR